MLRRIAVLSVLLTGAGHGLASAQTAQTNIDAPVRVGIGGTLVDQQGNTAIPGASITLFRGDTAVARTQSAASGTFAFPPQPAGEYHVLINASGYRSLRSDDVSLIRGDSGARLSLVLERSSVSRNLTEIGRTSTSSSTALQTTATISRVIEPQVIQNENFSRVGNALEQMPGVNLYNKNNSVGDDLYIDIRGLKPSETQTLLDGHPIGPIGVAPGTSGTFNMQDSPPYALGNVLVTYGAGALGLYGTNSTGGSINFQTVDPMPGRHAFIQQGYGNQGKSFTNLRLQGEEGKFGYAVVHATQGTYGPFAPAEILQNGNLGTNFTSKNIAANTYVVSANYLLRDDLLKLRYNLSPATQLTLTGYAANSYDDKTANGDNNATTYPYQLATAPINKATATYCPGGVTIKVDSGKQCDTAQNWASATTGPQGSLPAWQSIGNQDYHARLTTKAANTVVTVDGFLDSYNLIYNRHDASFDKTTGLPNGGYSQNVYHTSGLLISDGLVTPTNEVDFGYYVQHQLDTGNTFIAPTLNTIAPASVGNGNVFFRDSYTPNSKLAYYGNLWIKTSTATHGSTLDPRLSVVDRLSPSDVVRIGGAKSEGDPNPLLVDDNLNTTPTNLNIPCGALLNSTGTLVNVGQIGNSKIGPEVATDLEAAYSHRFARDTVINLDLYDTNEANQIFNSSVSAAGFAGQIPPALLQGYFDQISRSCPDVTPNINQLSLTQASNLASARFQGVEISGRIRLTRRIFADLGYDLQSAKQLGVPAAILKANSKIINGSQILGIPLHKQSLGIDYASPGGFETRIDAFHLDDNNGLNRPGYVFANGFISYSSPTQTTFNFGVYNIFDSAVGNYGLIGLGIFQAENAFGGDRTPFDQGVKYRGQAPRSFQFSIGQRI